MLHISKEWEIPARQTASQNSSIISRETIYQLQFTSNSHEKLKNMCNWHHHKSVQSETDSSGMTPVITLRICLLATVHESRLYQLKKFETSFGVTHQVEYTPHPPTKEASNPDHSLEGYQFGRKVALKFTGS